MKIKKMLAGLMLAALAVTAIAPAASANGGTSIVDKLSQVNARNGEFSTLLTAATCYDDIATALSDPSNRWTLYAPTNKAFGKSLNDAILGGAANCWADDAATKAVVKGVLLDHVVPRRVSNFELRLKARRDGTLPTLDGRIDVSGSFFRPRLGTSHEINDPSVKRDKARVVGNLRAGKSVIRVIDRVIIN